MDQARISREFNLISNKHISFSLFPRWFPHNASAWNLDCKADLASIEAPAVAELLLLLVPLKLAMDSLERHTHVVFGLWNGHSRRESTICDPIEKGRCMRVAPPQ